MIVFNFKYYKFYNNVTHRQTHTIPSNPNWFRKKCRMEKQDIIVETDGQYPKKVCVSIWGDKINEDQLQIGNLLQIDIDIESREYNSKWYTDIKAWKIGVADTGAQIVINNAVNTNDLISNSDDDGLPF